MRILLRDSIKMMASNRTLKTLVSFFVGAEFTTEGHNSFFLLPEFCGCEERVFPKID